MLTRALRFARDVADVLFERALRVGEESVRPGPGHPQRTRAAKLGLHGIETYYEADAIALIVITPFDSFSVTGIDQDLSTARRLEILTRLRALADTAIDQLKNLEGAANPPA